MIEFHKFHRYVYVLKYINIIINFFFHVDMQSFSNETEMIDTYTLYQAQDPLISVVAVVFERYKQNHIKYKIRHSWNIPSNLFQTVDVEHLTATPTVYFAMIPFVQLQMCLDEAFINQKAPGSMSNIKVLQSKEIYQFM